MFVPKLAFSNFTTRKARAGLTVAAIALSVSLVVAVTSGYASISAAAYHFLTKYLGAVDVTITRQNDPHGGVPEKLVGELQSDPQVQRAIGRIESQNGLVDQSSGEDEPGKMSSVIGIRRPDDMLVANLQVAAGGWFDGADGDVAVVDQAVAQNLKLDIGGMIKMPGLNQPVQLKIVGIVHKPQILAERHQTVYVPLHTLQRLTGLEGQVSRILVQLKSGVNPETFASLWRDRLNLDAPGLKIGTVGEAKKQMDSEFEVVHLLSYMGTMISMVAATFIVFSALSMGVSERQRTLAMLRAVGARRAQVAALVVVEGILLALTGILVGVPLGWLWIHILGWTFKDQFSAGVVMSPGGILFGTAGSLLAALAASLLPAWSALRVSPLEAMSAQSTPPSPRLPAVCAAVGLFLILIDPLLFFGPVSPTIASWTIPHAADGARVVQFYGHFILGLPSMMIGFFLMSPMFVWLIETVAGPAVAALMGIRFSMLRQQLSGSIWRSAGTATALMVGLASLVVLQVQGHTSLKGWRLPDKFPDIFIATPFGGVKPEDSARLGELKGIRHGELTPIALASPGLPPGFFGLMQAMIMPDATMFFGVDPDQAFKLMELEFEEGNSTDAAAMLKQGRHVIITNEFRELRGLHVGGKLPLKTIHGMVDYTVAGVVWSPGLDVIVSIYDMGRQMDQRTAASIFGSLEDAKRDFGVERYYLFAANLDYALDKEVVLKEVQKELKLQGMRAGDVRELKYQITTTFGRIILLISTVAFAAMGVASLGVANTIMASIRSRRWQFGILRSIGVTRSLLLRMVLAEGLLLGLVGCGLGLASGAIMSIDAHKLSISITGYNPPMSVPWTMIGIGTLIVLAIALLATIGPAVLVARDEPLALLQAGRASA